MMPDSVVLLAGFVLAHAAWSISDVPKGELLIPLAVVESAGQRQLIRFEAPTQEAAIAKGKATLAGQQAELDARAFAREGLMPDGVVIHPALIRQVPHRWRSKRSGGRPDVDEA
jgi:hypothetical protein